MDDIIIYGQNLMDHNNKLEDILRILRANNLKVQTEKCHFLRKEIQFLGHIVTPFGIKPNPKTTEVILNFPVPKNPRHVKSFIGLSSFYRKFIPNFSTIAEPLNELTRKNKTFIWSTNCQIAFDLLKQQLINPPILQYPDFRKIFTLTTDASDYGLGAILSQNHEGSDLPIAYASRALNKAERNYSTIEKEMLATKWGTNVYRPYLFGRKFQIVTDHKPLVSDLRNTSKRIQKWRIELAEYDYDVLHKLGKANANADALSRIKHDIKIMTRSKTNATNNNRQEESSEEEQEDLQEDEHIDTTIHMKRPKPILITEENKKKALLYEYHDTPFGGHSGTWKMYNRMALKYCWPNLNKDMKQYIKNCKTCRLNKSSTNTKVPLASTTTASKTFEKIAIDLVGPLPMTENGNKYLLTFQDELPKFSGATPLKDIEAKTVVKALMDCFITIYGIPKSILTDRGSQFTSEMFEELCRILKIKHLATTAFHPQTNGALERSHKTLKEFLRCFPESDPNWDEMVHFATFFYNTSPHVTTKLTPYEVVFGELATIPCSLKKEEIPSYNYDDYVSELKARLRLAHHIARQNILKSKELAKEQYDKNAKPMRIEIGDKVYLKNNSPKNKLDKLFEGPYEVTEVHSSVNTTIKRKGKPYRVHNNRLKLAEPTQQSA